MIPSTPPFQPLGLKQILIDNGSPSHLFFCAMIGSVSNQLRQTCKNLGSQT